MPRQAPARESWTAAPEGYSFTTVRELALEPMDSGPAAHATPPPPAWLNDARAHRILEEQAAAQGRAWAFAWLHRAAGTTERALREELEQAGASVVGGAGALLRVRVPADAAGLQRVAELPEVAALGPLPPEHKASQEFVGRLRKAPMHDAVPVFVTLMAPDPDGRSRRRLESLGLTVGAWDADVRAYAANLPPAALDDVLALDFVAALEPVGVVRALHDSAVPVMGADGLRRFDGMLGSFVGVTGAGVPIGVMDTGLNVRHPDTAHHRGSICGANFISGEDHDLWFDFHGHGSHVAGTIAGSGIVNPLRAGMAPGVRDIRFAKVLSSLGSGNTAGVSQGMSYLARRSDCTRAGKRSLAAQPLIVNMSLSASGLSFSGRGVGERKLDATVWAHRQLYVVAQSNSSVHGFSNYGTAKNSLAVGAVADSGAITSFSSHGPTADGRLAPGVVGTGYALSSVRGRGSTSGYVSFSGTSMAAPSVAGVAALLMDAEAAFREQPALVRARLMASAVKPDAYLDAGAFALANTHGPGPLQHEYGLGLVSARLAVLQRDAADGWTSGAAVREIAGEAYGHVDVEVPDGAARLDLVLTWDEPPADTLTESVLSDLDLWLDAGADCGAGPCGEHGSRSRIDNVEWIVVPHPAPGRYRVKVVPERIVGVPPRAALAWTVVRGPSTPTLTVTPANAVVHVTADERVELDLTLTVDGYVASGVALNGLRPLGNLATATVLRSDGLQRVADPGESWRPLFVGEIAAGEARRVTLTGQPIRHSRRMYFAAHSWNAAPATAYVDLVVDGELLTSIPRHLPANDMFEDAQTISGTSGERAVDLTRATVEPGEPGVDSGDDRDGRRVAAIASGRSGWWSWRAPVRGHFAFRLREAESARIVHGPTVSVFEGDTLAALRELATSNSGGVGFHAIDGAVYRIRVSAARGTGHGAQVLAWAEAGRRPLNDDFADATPLVGADGAETGSNLGATLERGEFHGDRAASVWYDWRAPEGGGYWEFSAPGAVVLVFRGNRLSRLRLVSGDADAAVFPVKAGASYRIAVMSPGTESAGGAFELTWAPADEGVAYANDAFAGATTLEPSEGRQSAWLGDATVEPGEPSETGVQTRWWSWRASRDGRFTWRVEDARGYAVLNVFTGESVDSLIWLAGGSELVIDALEGRTYLVSLGKRHGPSDEDYHHAGFVWGPTPANDSPATASALYGVSGAMALSNLHATTEGLEASTIAGHSGLWWNWSAPAAGWYRFWLDEQPALGSTGQGVLAIYRPTGGSPEFVRSTDRSYVLNGNLETAVLAAEGERFLVLVAARVNYSAGTARFGWQASEAPAWLRYSGRLVDGATDANGAIVRLEWPTDIAVDDERLRLFVISGKGLLVFDRDAETGMPTLAGNLEAATSDARLVWDSERAVLYGLDWVAGGVTAFDWLDGGPGAVQHCDDLDGRVLDAWIIDDFLTVVGPSAVSVHRRASTCEFSLVQRLSGDTDAAAEWVPGLTEVNGGVFGAGDGHLHVVKDDALLTFARNAATGRLRLVSEARHGTTGESGGRVTFPTYFSRPSALWPAFDTDRRTLILGHSSAPLASAFDTWQTEAQPRFLATIDDYYMQSLGFQTHVKYARRGLVGNLRHCARGVAHGPGAIDVVCGDGAYVVGWNLDRRALEVHDWFGPGAPDRFGNELPLIADQSWQRVVGGKHLYVLNGGDPGSLYVFQRAASVPVPGDGPAR